MSFNFKKKPSSIFYLDRYSTYLGSVSLKSLQFTSQFFLPTDCLFAYGWHSSMTSQQIKCVMLKIDPKFLDVQL